MKGNRLYNTVVTVLAWFLVLAWLILTVHDHPLVRK